MQFALVSLPIQRDGEVIGTVDVVHQCVWLWDRDTASLHRSSSPLSDLSAELTEAVRAQHSALERLAATSSSTLGRAYDRQYGALSNAQIAAGLQRAAWSGQIVPVMVGTLMPGCGGHQMMTDILYYLLGHGGSVPTAQVKLAAAH